MQCPAGYYLPTESWYKKEYYGEGEGDLIQYLPPDYVWYMDGITEDSPYEQWMDKCVKVCKCFGSVIGYFELIRFPAHFFSVACQFERALSKKIVASSMHVCIGCLGIKSICASLEEKTLCCM